MSLSDNPIELLKAGKYPQALEGFKHQLKSDPLKQDALHFYGLLSVISNNISDGLSYLTLAFSLAPNNSIQLTNIFRAIDHLRSNGYLKEVDLLLSQITSLTTTNSITALSLAKYHLLRVDNEAALAVLNNCPEESLFNKYFLKAISLQLVNKITDAKQYMARALQLQPYHCLYNKNSARLKPRILLIYGLDDLDFHASVNDDIAFSIYGGHFNVHMFVDTKSYNLSRLFVSESTQYTSDINNINSAIDGYDLIINCISDVEVCEASLDILNKTLSDNIPIINNPRAVKSTSRELVYEKIKHLNLLMAQTHQLMSNNDKWADQGYDFNFPFLLRPLGSSTGIGLEKIVNDKQFTQYLANAKNNLINVCPFIDFKSDDGLYRKYRVFVINGKIYPEHCVAHNHWNVHSSSRLTLMTNNTKLREEEQQFVDDIYNVLTKEQCATILSIYETLELDYFGIDFSITANGTLLIFEANAGMRVNPDYINAFNYLSEPINNIVKAFDKMIVERMTNSC